MGSGEPLAPWFPSLYLEHDIFEPHVAIIGAIGNNSLLLDFLLAYWSPIGSYQPGVRVALFYDCVIGHAQESCACTRI